MSVLWWVLTVYLGIGALIGLLTASCHVKDGFRDLPGFRRRGMYALGCVTVAVIGTLIWPTFVLLMVRAYRQVRAEQAS